MGGLQESAQREVGSMRWGDFKPQLADAMVAMLEPIQQRYQEIRADDAYLTQVRYVRRPAASRCPAPKSPLKTHHRHICSLMAIHQCLQCLSPSNRGEGHPPCFCNDQHRDLHWPGLEMLVYWSTEWEQRPASAKHNVVCYVGWELQKVAAKVYITGIAVVFNAQM